MFQGGTWPVETREGYISGWELAHGDKRRRIETFQGGTWPIETREGYISVWDLAHRDKGRRIHFRVGLGP